LLPENSDKRNLEFKIVLVDDDPFFTETLKDYLNSMNIHDVETFASGEEFLATLDPKDKKFVICDYDFGASDKLNGLQILEEARKRNDAIPVVMLSSHDKLDVALSTLRAGAIDYFIKGNESTFTTVLTSVLKTNEIYRLRKDHKDFLTLGAVAIGLFTIVLILSYYYR
ncbi:MAG: response regulator, partial [Bacteroidota bacterium]